MEIYGWILGVIEIIDKIKYNITRGDTIEKDNIIFININISNLFGGL